MDGKLTLKFATPAGAYEDTFDTTTKVFEVIAAVVKAMNLAEGDAFELDFDGEKLEPDAPIGSFGLQDGAVLDLIASAGGVAVVAVDDLVVEPQVAAVERIGKLHGWGFERVGPRCFASP